ncbi:thaumatin-like protein 1-like [Moniliophthora roreri]|nr:thaumatin-like protein 1-like [Moniliophthora roreri]
MLLILPRRWSSRPFMCVADAEHNHPRIHRTCGEQHIKGRYIEDPEHEFSFFILSMSPLLALADHKFTLTNRCGNTITPVIADTKCGYSPPTLPLNPSQIGSGESQTVTIPSNWVGRIFAQNGSCGPKGEGCSVTEFNLDSGDAFTPQSYDISNIQGFTQSFQIGAAGAKMHIRSEILAVVGTTALSGDVVQEMLLSALSSVLDTRV